MEDRYMLDVSVHLDKIMAIESMRGALIAEKGTHFLFGAAGFVPIVDGLGPLFEIYEGGDRTAVAMGETPELDDVVYVMETTVHMIKEIRKFNAILWVILSLDLNLAMVKREIQKIIEGID